MRQASDLATANPLSASASPFATSGTRNTLMASTHSALTDSTEPTFSAYKIIRRNGSIAPFAPEKIAIALTKAFLAVNGGHEAASARMRDQVRELTQVVVAALLRHKPSGGTFHIEEVQDQVELALMRGGAHEAARS